MGEEITLELSIQQFEQLLLNYYKKYFNDENIKVKHAVLPAPDGWQNIKISISRNIKIGNYSAVSETTLLDSEVKKAINVDLEKQGYSIQNLYYNRDRTDLAGITLKLNRVEKEKQKTK